jgi:hypothetical protein
MGIKIRFSVAAFAACSTFSSAALAQQVVALSAGFLPDPRVVAGMSGGPVPAMNVQRNCRGYIPPQPTVILNTNTGFNFLRVFAQSPGDTTLMVRGTTGTWCADDTYGANPGVDLSGLPPGRYDIYVGSYSANASHPFQLSFTEMQHVTPNGAAQPMQPQPMQPMQPMEPMQPPPVQPQYNNPPQQGVGFLGQLNFNLPPLFGRAVVSPLLRRSIRQRGRTGGAIAASNVRGEGVCRGYMAGPPSHVLLLPQPVPYLHLFAFSGADTTLVVRRSDGSVLCNDDTYNLNPSIENSFPAGPVQVWVGAYRQNEALPYQLTVTTDPNDHP